ncbi:MAG: SpoIIE family protein phosphatase [Rhodothermales bacterium]|nr:SpoIIE family protein phosphatase [Rhodothermales bacterium]
MGQNSILIVEDEHTLRRLLEYRLSKQYDVRTASNGEEALARIEERAPDMIISDIMMPKMDGFALQNAVQSKKETSAIPFIFLTAKADEQSRTKGLRTGVDDYITKPFDIEQLLKRVDRLLERTKQFKSQLDARISQDFSQRLIPKNLPNVDDYRILFRNAPKEDGGGDLFDWIEVGDGTYLFTIGDVMGKGLQAKFYAFSFFGYVRSTIHAMLPTTTSPAKLMARVNQALIDDSTMEETFASLLLIKWEPASNTITYVNAGHCRPVIIGPDSSSVVEHSDLILGLDHETDFKDTVIELKENMSFVAYTDGLSEQVLSGGKMVGEQGILDHASRVAGKDDPIDELLTSILSSSGTPEFADDILVFWLQRTGLNWFAPFANAG